MSNVFDFGAIGDGVTDETEALQHAIDAGDGVLQFNKGTYRISAPLQLDLSKIGFGGVQGASGASRIVMAGPGPALRILGDHQGSAFPGSIQPSTWNKERFPVLSGFEIVGEHPEADGIELRKTMKCTISQVLVRNCRHGIHLVERNRDFILADSHIYDNRGIGVFFDECNLHQIILHGNHISWNKIAGIKSQNGDVHNLQIVGNDIEYNNITAGGARATESLKSLLADHHGGAEIWFDATRGVISEVTISGNTIQATVQSGGANIRIEGAMIVRGTASDRESQSAPDTAHLINITGNVLGSQWRAIDLRYASRVTVTGNTIYDSSDLSIRATHCSGVAIAGNTFGWRSADSEPKKDGIYIEDSMNVVLSGLVTQRFCAGTQEKGAGIWLVRCRECAVSDCQILDPLHRGLELDSCTRCRIVNNTIIDRRTALSMRHAIRVIGQGSDHLIAHNMLGQAIESSLAVDGDHFLRENVLLDR